MTLEALVHTISSAIQPALDALESRLALPPLGLRRPARLPFLAALRSRVSHPILLLTDRADHALTLLDELTLWLPDAARIQFPEPNPMFYEDSPWGETTRRDRLAVLTALANYHIPGQNPSTQPQIIVAPIRAVMARTLPRRDFLKAARPLKIGQTIAPDDLARNWVALGFEASSIVIAPGQFARRGGLLDVWPPAELQPVRVEFFGDEIETLRRFEPSTQRTVGSLDCVLITPAREYIQTTADGRTPTTISIPPSAVSGQRSAVGGLPPAVSEYHIPLLHSPASLLDYLPRNALVLLDDRQALQDAAAEIEEQAVALRRDLVADGSLPADYPLPYITWGEIEDTLPAARTIELGGFSGIAESGLILSKPADGADNVSIGSTERLDQQQRFTPITQLSDNFRAGPRFGGRLKALLDHLSEACERGEAVYIVSRQSARLQDLWKEHQSTLNVEPFDNASTGSARRLRAGSSTLSFFEGSLGEGFTFIPSGGLPAHLLTDGEIFGWRRPEARPRARAVSETPEAFYADLQSGDWVVHVDHGLGKFGGLVRRTVDGVEREYLDVEYAHDAHLYVPVYQADRLMRYVGAENREPALSSLGGAEWKHAKETVRAAVQDVAHDLLELYAQRQLVQGHAFSGDSAWQQELEASFPYVETTDQLRVLREVKVDMESRRPMDRLICGDVGYGKTEVALRAAFKAVMEGKQVAVLVPTTVLAQQHFHTFRERLAAFPAEVEMLSRFRTPQQQQEILKRASAGKVDILIGTHRLLSSDVTFKDLGLLIIDEEQRFGVSHKETLKRMRTEVDVLTLTATPIPRTLYMALTGVRDISTINTPPEERLPILTHVGPFSTRIIRQAAVRELERGGQIFFVHNRVQTIDAMCIALQNLVPEARISVGHGQMPEEQLSKVMEHFSEGEVDILLCTTIIESGLDIPNANTLIVDRADTFGLAQLYQLRGRVGRGAQRAYAYFFRHKKIPPTLEGRQRLETIAENTQLGAGFSIAMRDLEIRGAGELLGMRQSGHIAAVGFHLYTRLLADAVRHLRVEQLALSGAPERVSKGSTLNVERYPSLTPSLDTPLALPVNVDLPLPIGLPGDYVADDQARLRLYRRIADLRSLAEVDSLAEEFNDRFGPPTESVKNLLFQLRVKLLAEKAGLASVSSENGQIVLRYPPLPEGAATRNLAGYAGLAQFGVRVGKNAFWMKAGEDWPKQLVEVLERLV